MLLQMQGRLQWKILWWLYSLSWLLTWHLPAAMAVQLSRGMGWPLLQPRLILFKIVFKTAFMHQHHEVPGTFVWIWNWRSNIFCIVFQILITAHTTNRARMEPPALTLVKAATHVPVSLVSLGQAVRLRLMSALRAPAETEEAAL